MDDPRVGALVTWEKARTIYLPGGNLPTGASPALAVAVALTELVAAEIKLQLQT